MRFPAIHYPHKDNIGHAAEWSAAGQGSARLAQRVGPLGDAGREDDRQNDDREGTIGKVRRPDAQTHIDSTTIKERAARFPQSGHR